MLNLGHWRLLAATADTGNISRAAERVGMTQSGASQAIAQLEASLGIQVFTRSRKEVKATALGAEVIEHARAMLSHLESIRALADASRGLSRGRVRLGSFPSVISTLLPPLLRSFGQRHPGIEVVALEGTDEEVEDWLAQDAIDLGVTLNPAAGRKALILGRDRWMALLPGAHALARRSSAAGVTLAELAAQPFILATGGCRVNGASLAREAGLTLSDVRVTVRDWASACALVREGMGVAVVPESTLPADLRQLRALPLTPAARREFGLVRSATGRQSAAAGALWKHIAGGAAGG
ncbi:LysR family transcriptional regulator [Achromobacter pulmonis]|uniref:LysR family transcriptional regulator n=1 Tax=Achromobacter pulmonis TaxID=1389932 RepID=A0A2N8KJJ4_9BURK|nr:LysR family transcriptional regulator [Achromobacter pulmonis]PND33608.1 LysR family transcriptional regulator [Achromobacter pulmonis]